MTDILEKMFGSAAKVKIMRLFLLNPEQTFDFREVTDRSKVTGSTSRRELGLLEKIGLIKKRSYFKDSVRGQGRGKKTIRRRVQGWALDDTFEFLIPLQGFLIDVSPLNPREILKKLSRIGRLKLVIVSGVFIQNWDSRVDLLVVGDNIKRGSLENTIKTLESEVGREIRFASFETSDFQYRFSMYDKLVRDILDFPHEKILDRIGLEK